MGQVGEMWSVGGRSGIEVSPFSGPFRRDGTTLDVQITRPRGTGDWILQVVAPDGRRRVWDVWDRSFHSDQDAYCALLSALEAQGVAGVMGVAQG